MKFRVERDTLADAVTWVARGLPARPPVPVLAGVLLSADAEAGTITLSAFDYEVSARISVPADVEEDPTLERGFTALTLGEAEGPIIHRDEWHRVKLRVVHAGDDHHILSIDDEPVLEVEDHRLTAGRFGGRVGLDMTHWDNILITKN